MATLMFCAHPGHELRVFGWVAQVRPAVCFLTDGSGADAVSRLGQSSEVLSSAGAVPGPLYGVATDRAVYSALLNGDVGFFTGLAARLAAHVIEGGYEAVVGDAAEGYNPSHDVARMLIDAAVRIAADAGVRVGNYAFPLVGHPHDAPVATLPGRDVVHLDDATLHTKIAHGRAYAAAAGGILVSEVDEAIERFGIEAFRDERLFVAQDGAAIEAWFDAEKPFYESHGERQVAAGRYSYVIRWREHVRPVARSLRQSGAPSALGVTTLS
jgi:hypothetical protein